MFEVLLFAFVLLLVPPGIDRLAWTIVVLLLSIPGIYAMTRGAPFVPSSAATMKRMLSLAKIKSGEKVYDLGCGDGRLVIAAAEQGANAIGYELSFPTYLFAKVRVFGRKGAIIRFRDFWKQDLRDADVVFCYLLVEPMKQFHKKIWPMLKPGTRVVSHSFRMPGIQPQQVLQDAVLYVKE